MAYGRLEVYYPDGAFKTFLLSDANISIGRSAGNLIALDVEGISRYHLALTHVDDLTHVADLESANGTFVDGERLKANAPQPLMGGEEIQIGEIRLVYHSFDETPTRPVIVPEETTRRVEIPDGNFTVDLFEPEQPVSPGAHISAQLTISNTSETPERYSVEVMGLPPEWIRIDRRELDIAPGKSGDVVLNFKPLRHPECIPGDYSVTALVRPKSNLLGDLRTTFALRVLPYGGFGMALEQRVMRPNESFRLHLHNQGSAPLTLNLSARDLSGELNVTLIQPRVTLPPGGRTIVQGSARPKQSHLFGDPRRFSFDLLVRSADAAGFLATTRAYALERPTFPGWVRYAAFGIGATLIALLIVALGLLFTPPTQPTIDAFDLAAQIVQGQPLNVTWQVSDTSALGLYIDGTLIAEPDPADGQTQIDTSTYTGMLTLELRAENNAGIASDTRSVQIIPSLALTELTVSPPAIYRYTLQTIDIAWSADAVTTQISGLEGFSTSLLTTTYGASGSLNVTGIWQSPLPMTIRVTAADENGQTIIRDQVVETLAVTCQAVVGDVAVYAAPDSRGQVIATILASDGGNIEITGRELNGTWLRIALSGGAQGWGSRDLLDCGMAESNGLIANLLLVPDVPTAPPDVISTATGTTTRLAPPTFAPLIVPQRTPTPRG